MAEYMRTHSIDGGTLDKDGGMLLPHTSIDESDDILSPGSSQQSGALASPVGFMSQTSNAGGFSSMSTHSQANYISHSALTGLAAAAAHHARYTSVGPNQAGNMQQGVSSHVGQGRGQMLTSNNSNGINSNNVSVSQQSPSLTRSNSMDSNFESDTGSGGANLSISYIRQGDNYVCSLCGKTVASKAAITRHIQLTHEKKKPFECNICHRRFGYKNILLEHQNIHFGIKPYSCNLCDKRFAARSNLFQHRLLHMKPFHCEVCNKRFDRADQLQRHLKLHPTSNVLSCSICNFHASNVEALNNHLKETHTLQTYNTRSRFYNPHEGDPRSQDLPTQVPLSSIGTNSSTSGVPMSLESEAMRKIDTICSQLASRSQAPQGNAFIKSEPTSPHLGSSPHGTFPSFSPSHGLSTSPFSVSGDSGPGYPPNVNAGHFHGSSGAVFPGGDTHRHSPPSGQSLSQQDNALLLSSTGQDLSTFVGDSPPSSMSSSGLRQSGGQFLAPNRRTSSTSSIPGIQSFSRQNRNGPPPSPLPFQAVAADRVRSFADSTSSLSEFFSTLQALIHRSQDIPELNVSISRSKSRQDVSTQYNSVSISGDVPALNDILIYYESQGKLYRCAHCRILFEERGMYFLHKSLHGELSPWECSICHKICADKNDFHLHFVNEQHQ